MALKAVLITGCSAGGIGSALVEAFQKRDLHIFATGRNVSKLSHLEKLPNVTILALDPTSTPSIQAAVEVVKKQTGGTLDYLVNNAGQTIVMPTLDLNIDAAQSMFDINVWGMMRVTQAFAPLVIAAKGTIANISSIGAALAAPYLGVYSGSKAAVTLITESLRLELTPFDVKVVTVMTGGVKTNNLAGGASFRLPPTSQYLSIEKEIAARARGEDGTPRVDAAAYAENVVGDILRGANSQIWRGGYASIVRYMGSLFPASILIKGTGLDVMKRS